MNTFINLRCTKPNGDFYITSSEVLLDKGIPEDQIMLAITNSAVAYATAGWNVEITQEELDVIDPEEYARWAADTDAQYYGEAV